MKKSIRRFYQDIGDTLKVEYGDLLEEFENRIKKDTPKEVFLWLERALRGKTISPKLDENLTDLLFSIH